MSPIYAWTKSEVRNGKSETLPLGRLRNIPLSGFHLPLSSRCLVHKGRRYKGSGKAAAMDNASANDIITFVKNS